MGFLDKLLGRTRPDAGTTVTRCPAPLSAHRGRARPEWVPAGTDVVVAGRTIGGGMFYVGSRAPSGDGLTVEPALVDPTLPVDWARPEWEGLALGYWPSYSRLTPGARAAFLTWLNAGRCTPSAAIGYVFVFFYGLERRVLLDARLDADHPDVAAAAREVRRLLAIYGNNASFDRYATSFLDLIEAAGARTAPLTPPDWSTLERTWEVPRVVRVALARYLAAGQPIPAEWALLLLRTHPEVYLRTPAKRCAAEFDELFRRRYHAKYADGMVVRPPKTPITLHYRPASGGMRGDFRATFEDLPDITSVTGPTTKLCDLASECTDALDAYSRHLGRRPDNAGTPAAAALLPDELVDTHGGAEVGALRRWIHGVVLDGPTPVAVDDLVARWSPGKDMRLAKADAVALAGLLAKVGIGIEPDVRFGGVTPQPRSTAVLFRLGGAAAAAPSPQYAAAAVLVHLTAVIASADGTVSDDERRHLAKHLEAVLALDADERARLDAHFAWLTTGTPSLAGMKRRLDSLDAAQRAAIGRYLVDLAAADGAVSAQDISTLTKLFGLLGLDEGDVYRTVHALGTDTSPVTVRSGDTSVPRWAIPAHDAGPPAVRLDAVKVQARLAETATVTALLAAIFTDEDDQTADTTLAPPAVDELALLVAGLDAPHSTLASRLRAQRSWARGDAEDVATSLGLPFLDCAVDRVNEAAIDACGEPLVEGDDPLEINDYAAEELF